MSQKLPNYGIAASSITEWMEHVHVKRAKQLRHEDRTRTARLKTLSNLIGLPYEVPISLPCVIITNKSERFIEFYNTNKNNLYTLRLLPKNRKMPKMRIKRQTLKKCIAWLFQQKINPKKYEVEIVPQNPKILYSSIFIIDDKGVVGEIIKGPLWQLSEGIFIKEPPIIFFYDFNKWKLSRKNKLVTRLLQKAIDRLRVHNYSLRKIINKKMKSKFTKNGFIHGHFEFIVIPKRGIKFIDYNRIQTTTVEQSNILNTAIKNIGGLRGICASRGLAEGVVRIVSNPKKATIREGDILVCKITTIDYIHLMKKAGAIITEKGTLLSHPAVISREMKKPCIVGVLNATKKLKEGSRVLVDANNGVVELR